MRRPFESILVFIFCRSTSVRDPTDEKDTSSIVHVFPAPEPTAFQIPDIQVPKGVEFPPRAAVQVPPPLCICVQGTFIL
ncbi:hypothetical protein DPMN_153883 [Dreissena polymorpha]|uniref:Uncharacterized protein n=1 Tax=Dreissena polymorpha TaxID=45954 RepID=A0A9D4FQR0_DREPO|nr:hypothetical protein DPMN_153883 [Dreissena polymorpha]